MRILIIEDTLNGHSGTTRLTINIANGFQCLGDEVFMVFFSETEDSRNVRERLRNIDYYVLSDINKQNSFSPLRWYLLKKMSHIKGDDIADFLAVIKLKSLLKKHKFIPDLIILSNFIAGISTFFLNKSTKKILYLHEAPIFNDFNPILRFILRSLVERLNKETIFVAISEDISNNTYKSYGFRPESLMPIGFENPEIQEKKNEIILLDTRWTNDRDPLFILDIIKELNYNFIMHGFITSEETRAKLISKIQDLHKDKKITLLEGLSSKDLSTIYSKSKIVIRWAGFHESGNSLSIYDAISYECVPVIDKHLGISNFIAENIGSEIVVNKKAEEFVNVLNKIMNDEEFYNLILNRVRITKKQFSWSNYSLKLKKI